MRAGRSNSLYWTPHCVFIQGGYIPLGLHDQIPFSHRRLLQRSETQCFSCLLHVLAVQDFALQEMHFKKA